MKTSSLFSISLSNNITLLHRLNLLLLESFILHWFSISFPFQRLRCFNFLSLPKIVHIFPELEVLNIQIFPILFLYSFHLLLLRYPNLPPLSTFLPPPTTSLPSLPYGPIGFTFFICLSSFASPSKKIKRRFDFDR